MGDVENSDNDLHSRMVRQGFNPTPVEYAADAFRAASERKNPHSTGNLHVLGNWSKDGPEGVVNVSLILNGAQARLVVLPVDPSDDVRNGRRHLAKEPVSFPVWQLDSDTKLAAALTGTAPTAAFASQLAPAKPLQTQIFPGRPRPNNGSGLGIS